MGGVGRKSWIKDGHFRIVRRFRKGSRGCRENSKERKIKENVKEKKKDWSFTDYDKIAGGKALWLIASYTVS